MEIDFQDRDTHTPRSKFCKCCKWVSLVWTKFLMTESAETEVLTPAPRPGILGTLSNQITAEYGLCSAVPIIRWARDAEKGCLLALVDTWHLTSCDAWHHNTWHRTVTRHTRDRNNPEQLSGCYRGVMTCDCIFRLRRVTRSVTPRPGCGLRWVVTRVTWPHTDNHWIKFWNLSPGFMINLLIGALQRH